MLFEFASLFGDVDAVVFVGAVESVVPAELSNSKLLSFFKVAFGVS